MITSGKSTNHYVTNKSFLEAYEAWRPSVLAAEAAGLERPPMPNYLAQCIVKIASKLAFKSNFINYSYRDDMVGDAISIAFRKLHKFDPAKSSNMFAYVTQICYNAFILRINAEKKQAHVKGHLINMLPADELFTLQSGDADDPEFKNNFIEFLRENTYADPTPKIKVAKVGKVKPTTDLEKLMQDTSAEKIEALINDGEL